MDRRGRFLTTCAAVGALVTGSLAMQSFTGVDGWRAARDVFAPSAAAQELPEDDDDDADDNDDPGGDGVGDDDVGNDGNDDAGDDVGDIGDIGDDDAGGGDDDAGGAGGDDGGDDGGAGTGDDDGPGGDDDDGSAGGGNDDDDNDTDNDKDDDGRSSRRARSADPPGGAGVRGVSADSAGSINDGDADTARLRNTPEGVDLDDEGRWIRDGELLALEIDPTSLELARSLGFQVEERFRLTTLGQSIVRLRVPKDMNAREALKSLREASPGVAYDFNHLYFPMQRAKASSPPPGLRQGGGGGVVSTLGMIDSAVAAGHPSLRSARIEQRDFVTGAQARPTDHGTAVASLMIGQDGTAAAGTAPRTRLLAAGVIGQGAQHQLAAVEGLVRALDWLSGENAPVINISLAGPPNALLEDAVRRTLARGTIIVAAVGNDGPAAPPLYPAALSGVVGVTAVDGRGMVYRRAGRGSHVDVAALGVGLRAANASGNFAEVTGTSFAAPLVAAWLAARHSRPDPTRAQAVLADLGRHTRDAGDAGPDPVFGVGILSTATGVQ